MLLAYCNYKHTCCNTYYRCASFEVDDGSKYLSAFIVSTVLQGFGSVPLYVLGITYLDDASPHGTAAVHMGIYSTATSLDEIQESRTVAGKSRNAAVNFDRYRV